MNLKDLYRNLALGELSNLSLASGETIIETKRSQITLFANDGLLNLHTRFVLLEKDILIEMQETVTNYHLIKKYSFVHHQQETDPDPCCLPYIIDTIKEPFEEDVIKIISVHNSCGISLPINDQEQICSVFTPQNNVLQVPHPIPRQALNIQYQARHTKLDHLNLNSEIKLPEILHSALRYYIAAKVFTHMNTQENTIKGQEHMLSYESACQDVIDRDLVYSSYSTTNSRFHRKGWV